MRRCAPDVSKTTFLGKLFRQPSTLSNNERKLLNHRVVEVARKPSAFLAQDHLAFALAGALELANRADPQHERTQRG